jgi:ribosome-binding factor A
MFRSGLTLWHFFPSKTFYGCLNQGAHSKFPSMESIRQKQVGEVIRRYFGTILTEEGSNIYGRGKLVTVTDVKMTPDLLVAKIYISVYGTEHKQEVILELEASHARLRQALAVKIGKQMRRMPDIEFFLDDTVDEMYRVDALLNRVHEQDQNLGE